MTTLIHRIHFYNYKCTNTFYIFIFGAFPSTAFSFVLCPGRWVIQLVRSFFSASQGHFPPSSLLFFLLHLFWMSLEPCSVHRWGNECNLGATWHPLLSSPFIIFFTLSLWLFTVFNCHPWTHNRDMEKGQTALSPRWNSRSTFYIQPQEKNKMSVVCTFMYSFNWQWLST